MIWIILAIIIIIMIIAASAGASPLLEKSSVIVSTKGKESIIGELTGVHIPETKGFILSFCKKGDPVSLEFEPENQYDSKAIKVLHGTSPIGYISKADNEEVGKFMRKYDYHSFIYKLNSAGGYLEVEIGLLEK